MVKRVTDSVKAGAVILIACVGTAPLARAADAAQAQIAAQIYARATNQFTAAVFWKPAAVTNSDLAVELAPLMLQECSNNQASALLSTNKLSNPAVTKDVPVSLFVLSHWPTASATGESNGSPGAGPQRPTVFYAADSVQINGRAHPRFSYEWLYPRADAVGKLRGLQSQGIRITLDARGQPALWEVLTDRSGQRLIFVSQTLEAAAFAQFGKPLPGRRYAIERELSQASGVIVPRVIDDGPVPTGPIVYLSEETRDVCTLICRCMPAQVKGLVATQVFDLTPLGSVPLSISAGSADGASSVSPPLWPTDGRVQNLLDQCLRLPDEF
jgi:hypothetical protein